MNIEYLPEPELEFGGGGRSVDIRVGLLQHGPFDRGDARAPGDIKVGLVGTPETIDGVHRWLTRCQEGLPARPGRQSSLFQHFPGCKPVFGIELVLDATLRATVEARSIHQVVARAKRPEAVDDAVQLFHEAASYLVESARPHVIVCAPPQQLLEALEREDPPIPVEEEAPEEDDEPSPPMRRRAFHDVLKARGMSLNAPIQMVRPETYSELKRPKSSRRDGGRGVQDPATRAWNFHTALYYKANGTPWRIARNEEYETCYVGVSFYKTLDEKRVMTSMAQVFNARGDGVVVRGGPARVEKDDRMPHLAGADAKELLSRALTAYHHEHRHQPARVVVHKTSPFNDEELDGFRAAAEDQRITSIELVSINRSFLRLFRNAYYPPLRGTLLTLDDDEALLYLKGSVPFFRAWPGMYVPRPTGFRLYDAEQPVRVIAQELLALSKQNWNNTQFDGGWPITVRAAQRVGAILKHIGANDPMQARYSFFM